MEPTEEGFLDAAMRVGRVLGESSQPVRIAYDTHPVFQMGSLVIRLEVCEVASEVASKFDNCRRMRAAGVPFACPVGARPIEVPGCAPLTATAWEYVERVEPLDWTALGRAVATLHDFDGITIPVSSLAGGLAAAVDQYATVDAELAERFLLMIGPLEELLDAVGWDGLALTASHGDLWTKNVIPRGAGEVVLCDPDFLGRRPIAFDLGLVFEETGGDDRWTHLVEGYGADRIPPVDQLLIGPRAAMANWITYVLTRRHDWPDYIKELSEWTGMIADVVQRGTDRSGT